MNRSSTVVLSLYTVTKNDEMRELSGLRDHETSISSDSSEILRFIGARSGLVASNKVLVYSTMPVLNNVSLLWQSKNSADIPICSGTSWLRKGRVAWVTFEAGIVSHVFCVL